MALSDHLDRWQRRLPFLGFPIATIYKFTDDFGNYLAALLTYYAFVSIFPLLLLGATALSVVLVGHPHLQEHLLDSALASFPVVGPQLNAPHALSGGTAGVMVGFLGAAYGALGVAQALQYAGNTVWGVPRNNRPNPFQARGRSMLLVGTAGIGMLAAVIGTSVLHAQVDHAADLPGIATFCLGIVVYAVVLLVAFRLATRQHTPVRVLLPGALIAAVALQLLQTFGYVYVKGVIRHASDLNAVFATVLGMLAYLYLAAMVVVLAMEINVVRAQHLWPRSLLTPFTDDVDLTDADQSAYTRQAQAQRTKGYEEIAVTFHGRSADSAEYDDGLPGDDDPGGPTS